MVLSQGHDQTVPNGARNGRLHTLSEGNANTNPFAARACVRLTQLLIVLCNSEIKKCSLFAV